MRDLLEYSLDELLVNVLVEVWVVWMDELMGRKSDNSKGKVLGELKVVYLVVKSDKTVE